MKLNKTNLFLKIWGVHLMLYYMTFILILRVTQSIYENAVFFEMDTIIGILLSPIGGLLGFLNGIPGFLIIPMCLMIVIINTNYKKQWFKAYLFSVFIAYLFSYLINKKTCEMYNSEEHITTHIDVLVTVVPSLIISISLNWLIFKNGYKQIQEGNSRI